MSRRDKKKEERARKLVFITQILALVTAIIELISHLIE